jgi:hypothetical protein
MIKHMTKQGRLRISLLGVAGSLILAAAAQAAEITGTDFDVIYDPTTLGLFGSLSLSGNTLEFTPNNFIATSLNGAGVATPTGGATTASNIQLVANPGFQFGSLQLTELGDYLLSGSGSSVSVSGELIAFDGDSTSNPVLTYTTSTITPTGPLTTNNGQAVNWTATAAIDNTTPTVSGGSTWLAGAQTVDVSIENLLSASTDSADSEALIQKKALFGGVGLTVTPVPLPGTVLLFGSALAFLGFGNRRRWTARAQ